MTCDAPLTNLPILKKLGASFDFSGIKSSFLHPSDHTKSVAVILNMLKLAWNTLADLKVLNDPEGNEIRWDFVEKLHEVQEEAGIEISRNFTLTASTRMILDKFHDTN